MKNILFLVILFPIALFSDPHSHFFPNPGIIGNIGGEWQGTDHLYNLSDGIEVFVEVLSTDNLPVKIDQNEIYDTVVEIFKKNKIKPEAEESNPPLPFFQVLVMVSKVGDNYAMYVAGRLFEGVTLKRFILDETTKFQAITWQRQSLNTFPDKELQQEVNNAVSSIAEQFGERFRYYDDLRQKVKR